METAGQAEEFRKAGAGGWGWGEMLHLRIAVKDYRGFNGGERHSIQGRERGK